MKKIFLKTLGITIITISLGLCPLYAETLNYDPYEAVFEEEMAPPSFLTNLSRLSFKAPLMILKWPVDKTLLYIEKHYVDKKFVWIYDNLEKRRQTTRRRRNETSYCCGFQIVLDQGSRVALTQAFPFEL